MAALRCPKQVFETNCVDQIAEMIKSGADPNATDQFGDSAMMRAAQGGRKCDEQIISLLLKGKADVNQAHNYSQSTPLMRAARKGKTDIAKILIDNKANPKLQHRSGATAAEMAKAGGHDEVFVMLGGVVEW